MTFRTLSPRYILLLLATIVPVCACMAARDNDPADPLLNIPDTPDGYSQSIYRGYNWTEDEFGEPIVRIYLKGLTVYPPLKFKSGKEEQFYWRTVRNVRVTLPYAKMIRETLIETYEYIETFPTQNEREEYLKKMEKELFRQYKPVLKKLSRQQANMLVKLIQRETDQSGYEIVKAFLGSFRATFWQGFGKLFGVSLNGKFSPSTNREDAIIDRVATLVEQGTL